MPRKISRAKAKERGLNRYFTGGQCVRGHIATRITASGSCHACVLEDTREKRSKKPGYRTRAEMDAALDAPTRQCVACKQIFQNTEEYFVRVINKKKNWQGLSNECRECRNKRFLPYYKKNRKKLIKRAIKTTRAFRQTPEGKEKTRLWAREAKRREFADPKKRAKATARNRRWRKKNPERVKSFKHSHPAMKRERTMARRARRLKNLSVVDKKKIETIYLLADYLTKKTGIAYEVDHVYPLIHKHSCGLHVPWNMRIITAKANQAKGNRLCVQ